MPTITGIRPTGRLDAIVAAVLRALLRVALKPVFSSSVPFHVQRRRLATLASLTPKPRGVRFVPGRVGGVAGEWVEPTGVSLPPPAAGRLLWLHGGAYCVGSPRTHRPLTGALARLSGRPVFVPDYRLAPEHPFPAALDDARAVLRAMTADGPVVVGGDSAGGGLTLALAMAARDAHEALPVALLPVDPWADPASGAGSPALAAVQHAFDRGVEPRGEPMLTPDWGAACAAAYAGTVPLEDPRISPLRGDLRGLPPVLLQVATDQWLYDQGLALHDALVQAGVPVRCEVHARRWHVFQIHAGVLPGATAAVERMARFARDAMSGRAAAQAVPPAADGATVREVVVVGAGVSGLVTGRALREAGQHDFEILEASAGIGGTWWDNRYPGAQVDVPAPLYSLRDDPHDGWTHRFADAVEIRHYLQAVALRHGLTAHLRLGDAVTEARFDEASRRWRLRTAGGRRLDARFLVVSTGPLSRPRWPDIPGLDRFAGHLLHTARWPEADGAALQGRRVGVIGTGSTAAQVIPPLAEACAHLTVFQRTANWVLPRLDRRYGALDRMLMRVPGLNTLPWRAWYRLLEWDRRGLDEDSRAHRALTRLARWNLERAIGDPALRERLTPPFPLGCKRLVYSNAFYPAFNRPNVELQTEAIERIEPEGVVTADGRLHPLDTLVCATGFDTARPLGALDLVGRGGRSIAADWAQGASAWRGVAVPGYPNLFLMLGPNTGTGHTSTIPYIEAQADFTVRSIQRLRELGARTLEVRPDACAAFNADLQRALDGSVWTLCSSWYRAPDGRVAAIWPHSTDAYRRALQRPDWSAFDVA